MAITQAIHSLSLRLKTGAPQFKQPHLMFQMFVKPLEEMKSAKAHGAGPSLAGLLQ